MIGVMGPPSGANNVRFEVLEWFMCDTLEDLKALETPQDKHIRLAVLRGRDVKFDGVLQGIYCFVPPGEQFEQDESDSWVIVNDRNSAWQKLL